MGWESLPCWCSSAFLSIIALPLVAAAPSSSSKQALAALDAVLKTEPSQMLRQQSMSVRKDEQLSSIPWLNKKLLTVRLGASSAQAAQSSRIELEPGPSPADDRSGFCGAAIHSVPVVSLFSLGAALGRGDWAGFLLDG